MSGPSKISPPPSTMKPGQLTRQPGGGDFFPLVLLISTDQDVIVSSTSLNGKPSSKAQISTAIQVFPGDPAGCMKANVSRGIAREIGSEIAVARWMSTWLAAHSCLHQGAVN